jgi:glycosyltransferase involved in cell wall biosynthesis
LHAYVLTTPLRNERDALPDLVASIDAQTVRPRLWLLIDDGSTDGSREFLDEAAATRPFLRVVASPEAPDEYLGHHIARIKRFGLDEVQRIDEAESGAAAAFAGVLDADMRLPANHYARLLDAMDGDPGLGIVSSAIVVEGASGARLEPFQRDDLPRGGTQFFRRSCLLAIGGLPPYMGFDGAANVKAMRRGYRLRLVADVVAVQSRETGTREGIAKGYARKGRYAWFLGHHPLLIALRAAAYGRTSPRAAWAFGRAWIGEAARRAPRCPDEEVVDYYRHRRLREYLTRRPGFLRRTP